MNYQPIPTCTCGALKTLMDYQHSEYVMKFLVGLDDSYASVRGQILLMDPLPTINKGKGKEDLVSQKERQRELSSGFTIRGIESGAAALAVNFRPNARNKNYGRKERPLCSHCGITGHTVEKCYRLHGFPPCYKPRARPFSNQVMTASSSNNDNGMANLASLPLSPDQYQQLLSFLNSQQPPNEIHPTHQVATVLSQSSNFSGISHKPLYSNLLAHNVFSSRIVNRTAFSHNTWIIDTGATNHMIWSITLFTKITSSLHATIKLPNGESALVTYTGTMKLSDFLILVNVLCVPSFSFNLKSVSKLTSFIKCCIFFLSNLCFIQDLVKWKMIGMGREKGGLYFVQSPHSDFSSFIPNNKSVHTVNQPKSMTKSSKLDLWHYTQVMLHTRICSLSKTLFLLVLLSVIFKSLYCLPIG